MTCKKHEDEKVVELLIKRGSRIDEIDSEGQTALMISVSKLPGLERTKILLQYGADVNIKDYCGRRAFDYGCSRCMIDPELLDALRGSFGVG